MRSSSVRHEKKGEVIGPVAATFVGRTGHVDEGGLEAFNSVGGFVVLSGGGAKVDATRVHKTR